MNQDQRASDAELNARFEAVMQQRNNAMNQNVIDAGTIADLQAKLEEATKGVTKAEEAN